MSSYGEITGPPDPDQELCAEPADVLAQLSETNADLRRIVGFVAKSPCQTTMRALDQTVEEARGLVHQLFEAEFFKKSQDSDLIHSAVGALVQSVRDTHASTLVLDGKADPWAAVELDPEYEETKELPNLVIQTTELYHGRGPNAATVIEEYANFILHSHEYDTSLVTRPLADAGLSAYEKLLASLQVNPKTEKFLRRAELRKNLRANPMAVGAIAVPACLLGAVAAETLHRYL